MKSLLAFLRITGLTVGTLFVFGFGPVPFVLGAVAQAVCPRRLPLYITNLLGTAAFLVAWLALDHVPFAFFRRPGSALWPSLAVGWLFSMANCQYATFLVRALWPRRFAVSPSLATPSALPAATGAEPLGRQDFRTTVSTLRFWGHAIKGSIIAFASALVLGFVSMGFLGAVLYYPVAPVLRLRFAPRNEWHGDWVWPAVLGVGMAWSAGFLIAGVVNHFLVRQQLRAALRGLVYLGILWSWALVIWTLTLTFAPNNPPL